MSTKLPAANDPHYAVARGNANPLAHKALAAVAAQSKHPTLVGTGMCLRDVRMQYGLGFIAPTAYEAWSMQPDAHIHTFYLPPAGVPVFWSGGHSGAGHIAIADGNGNVWSTDIKRPGKFDLVPIAKIHSAWGLKLLGWTDRLGTTSVYS